MEKQIKSRQRVVEHGEVFTAEREVNAMLDLVRDEAFRIDSRFLEPACGNGNFLVEVLRRKLSAARAVYGAIPEMYMVYTLLAVSSIYGIDIMLDNVKESRQRMYDIWKAETRAICGELHKLFAETVRMLLDANIICGNFLTLRQADEEGRDISSPIEVAQWFFTGDGLLYRQDYWLSDILKGQSGDVDAGMIAAGWAYDSSDGSWTPPPVRRYLPLEYRQELEVPDYKNPAEKEAR